MLLLLLIWHTLPQMHRATLMASTSTANIHRTVHFCASRPGPNIGQKLSSILPGTPLVLQASCCGDHTATELSKTVWHDAIKQSYKPQPLQLQQPCKHLNETLQDINRSCQPGPTLTFRQCIAWPHLLHVRLPGALAVVAAVWVEGQALLG